MNILIIQTGGIDEVILSTPILRWLDQQLNVKADYLTTPENTFLMEENPNCGRSLDTTTIPKTGKTYDVVINLSNNRISRRYGRMLGKKVLTYNSNAFNKWLFIKMKVDRLVHKHVVEQYADLVKPLGIEIDEKGLAYYIPDRDIVEEGWLPKSHRSGFATVSVTAPTKTQQLPAARLIELCDQINKPIILLGDRNDDELASEIELFFKRGSTAEEEEIEGLNKKALIFNGCGKFNLNQQASVIQQSSWVFSHASKHMHIAAAFQKPIFSIWGSNTPLFGKYPYNTKFTVFENNKIDCRPCSIKGFEKCPKKHFKCMKDVIFDFYLPD